MNLPGLKQPFANYLKTTRGLNPVSIKNYLSDFTQFARWVIKTTENNSFEASKIDHQLIESFKKYLLSKKIAKSTVKRKLATLRTFCQFCLNQKILTVDPSLPVRNPKKKASKSEKTKQLVNDFSTWLKACGASKNTIKNYIADIKSYLNWANAQQI